MDKELLLTFFGEPQVALGNRRVTPFRYRKTLALLCYLAVTERSHTREALAGLLWGEASDTHARNNLRKVLVDLPPEVASHLVVTRQDISFAPDGEWSSDVAAFSHRLGQLLRKRGLPLAERDASALAETTALYRGDFLEGFYVLRAPAFEEWMLLQREQFRMSMIQALHMLASHHEMRREFPFALDCVYRLLAIEPLQEEAHQQLVRLLAKSGRRAEALAHFEKCCGDLRVEFGIEPSEEMIELCRTIREGEGLSAPTGEGGPLHTPTPRPAPAAGEVHPEDGDDPVAQVTTCLDHPACHLLTIVGPNDISSMKLALQAASCRVGRFRDGAHLVSTAPLGPSGTFASCMASSLGLPTQGHEHPSARLVKHLRDKHLLLVIGCLKDTAGSAELLGEILRQAPGVKILVASQEPTSLRGEWTYELGLT